MLAPARSQPQQTSPSGSCTRRCQAGTQLELHRPDIAVTAPPPTHNSQPGKPRARPDTTLEQRSFPSPERDTLLARARTRSDKVSPERCSRPRRPVLPDFTARLVELLVHVIEKVQPVIDDVGLPHREHWMPETASASWQIPVGIHRDKRRHIGQTAPSDIQCCGYVGRTLAPALVPKPVVLNIEQDSLDGPGQLATHAVQVTTAPLRPRPRPGPSLFRRDIDREACRKERTMIVRELEAVLTLNASEFGIRQPRFERVDTRLRQTTRSLAPQTHSLSSDHRCTLAPTVARRHSGSHPPRQDHLSRPTIRSITMEHR
ncbi:hypothetical protein SAMN05421806_1168 [Streptomyces indicus]|uniref:Uncharacterized protein n=1 Tax=Streptomyces indicus TaxID=417292 RepID=A0A1G9GHT0_9ACTN|nr:hypothetical protein SAMN05421806_1168 [Streptomyces indicus]